ncbi:unnamed protein product [Caretta caretta]
MHGRKVNAEIEQRTHAPPDGLKHGWEGARLPAVPYHQARALDPIDPGGGVCRIDGLASLHPCQVARVLDHKKHVVGVRRQDQPQLRLPHYHSVNLLRRRQRKGSITRAYSWPERGHPCCTPCPKLTGSVRVQLSLTRHAAEAYSTRRKPTNWGPKPNTRRVRRRYPWSTLSNAFS